MCFTFAKFFSANRQAKITAISGGLAIGSAAVLIAMLLRIDVLLPNVMFDDSFFGQRRPYVSCYLAIDAAFMASLSVAVRRHCTAASIGGFVWTNFVLLETLFDVPVFAHDPHMLLEELLIAAVYTGLLILVGGHWLCSENSAFDLTPDNQHHAHRNQGCDQNPEHDRAESNID